MELVDTHCHLTHRRYDDDRQAVRVRAAEAGVKRVVTIASDARDGERVAEMVSDEGTQDGSAPARLFGTAGVHPHESGKAGPGDVDRIRDILVDGRGMVAVGETGLDYHYDHSPREHQRRLFLAHLELAHELDLPVVVHSREAEEDTRAILRDTGGGLRGVLHCFSGSGSLLDAALEAGWMVSFTGLVTFPNYDGGDLVARVPADRYMLETDGPYLAPVPYRGKRNEPARVREICLRVAELRGEDPEDVALRTTGNAMDFFGLPE